MDLGLISEASFWWFLGAAVLASAAAACFRPAWAKTVGAVALAGGLVLVGVICLIAGRLPMGGSFESLSCTALVMAALAFGSLWGGPAGPRLAVLTWIATALLLVVLVGARRQVSPPWFIFEFIWPQVFFVLRSAATAVLIYCGLAALACWGTEAEGVARRNLMARSRRYLLLGTALFLLGEVCGFYWCLRWKGDYWFWSRGFLESIFIFLVASAGLHLPPKLAARPGVVRLVYSLPGLLAVIAYVLRQIVGCA